MEIYGDMFETKVMQELLHRHRRTFEKLGQVERELNERFVDMQEPIHALVLALASGEPLLFLGPPGTGKSWLIRAFCELTGLIQEEKAYFEYLLTPFTEPGELFGFYDIEKLYEHKGLVRIDAGMMQRAKIVFLDEVFNGSSAILNSILAIMNERIFHDRGDRIPVRMQGMFAATNRVPETPELRAVYDRFILRSTMQNVPAQREDLANLIRAGWVETYNRSAHTPQPKGNGTGARGKTQRPVLSGLLDDLEHLREDIRGTIDASHLQSHTAAPAFYGNLTQCIQHARQYDLSEMSNRRIVKMSYIMLVHCLYDTVQQSGKSPTLGAAELRLIPQYFLDRFDRESVEKMHRLVWDMGM
jgi:hypothetical protein